MFMDNSIFEQNKSVLQTQIEQAQSIGVIVTEDQATDSVGAALALYLSLKNSGKQVQIISPRDPLVELSNLFGIGNIGKSFDGNINTLTISVPYREGEIGKVSYNIEGDRLNVNLFADQNGINFSEKDVQYIKKGSSPSLIFTVGIQSLEDINNFVDTEGVRIVNIDNSALNSYFGEILYVDPAFSSLSEIVTNVINSGGFTIDMDIAQNLLEGILSATQNFASSITSAYAFEAAGLLLKNGAKRESRERQSLQQPQQNLPRRFRDRDRRPRGMDRGVTNPQQTSRQDPLTHLQNLRTQPNVQQMPQDIQPKQEIRQDNHVQEDQGNVPSDWFAPKIFKGSKSTE